MRCRKCGEKAAINMRQHRLALCFSHYLDWFVEQTGRFIRKYAMCSPTDRILVAVSGGKDSLALWDVLTRLGIRADGLHLDLGIDEGSGYSAESLRLCREFAEVQNLRLHIVDIAEEYEATVPGMLRTIHRVQAKPCSLCGLSKRHEMNRIAASLGYDVLMTGHNLDDEVAVLFANTLNWSVEHLTRQAPVLEEKDGLARKAKPFCRFYERETAAYALLRGIEYIEDECPFAEGSNTIAYKELFNQLENRQPGAKLNFYLQFLQAKEEGLFAQTDAGEQAKLIPCPTCGQPTSSNGDCAFCRAMALITPPTTRDKTRTP